MQRVQSSGTAQLPPPFSVRSAIVVVVVAATVPRGPHPRVRARPASRRGCTTGQPIELTSWVWPPPPASSSVPVPQRSCSPSPQPTPSRARVSTHQHPPFRGPAPVKLYCHTLLCGCTFFRLRNPDGDAHNLLARDLCEVPSGGGGVTVSPNVRRPGWRFAEREKELLAWVVACLAACTDTVSCLVSLAPRQWRQSGSLCVIASCACRADKRCCFCLPGCSPLLLLPLVGLGPASSRDMASDRGPAKEVKTRRPTHQGLGCCVAVVAGDVVRAQAQTQTQIPAGPCETTCLAGLSLTDASSRGMQPAPRPHRRKARDRHVVTLIVRVQHAENSQMS